MRDGSEPAHGQEGGQGYARGGVAYRCLTVAMLFAGFSTFSMLYSVQPLLPLFATEYMCDPHEVIINHVGKVICRIPITLH